MAKGFDGHRVLDDEMRLIRYSLHYCLEAIGLVSFMSLMHIDAIDFAADLNQTVKAGSIYSTPLLLWVNTSIMLMP